MTIDTLLTQYLSFRNLESTPFVKNTQSLYVILTPLQGVLDPFIKFISLRISITQFHLKNKHFIACFTLSRPTHHKKHTDNSCSQIKNSTIFKYQQFAKL